jgi:hypothetical protein
LGAYAPFLICLLAIVIDIFVWAMLTAKRLRKLLSYDPATGVFHWRMRRGGVMAGSVAGCTGGRGRYQICVDWDLHQASRLAWLYMTGKWPKLEIAFINRKTSDTRWANLRQVTPSQRRAKGRTSNKHGVKGVCTTSDGKKYVARIKVAGKRTYLGSFDNLNEASAAYFKAAKDAFGPFARVR